MGGEDYSFMMDKVADSLYISVGTGNAEKGCCEPNHSGRFNVDEEALPGASAVYAQYAIDLSLIHIYPWNTPSRPSLSTGRTAGRAPASSTDRSSVPMSADADTADQAFTAKNVRASDCSISTP